jgi:hypothetical protein
MPVLYSVTYLPQMVPNWSYQLRECECAGSQAVHVDIWRQESGRATHSIHSVLSQAFAREEIQHPWNTREAFDNLQVTLEQICINSFCCDSALT